jgi:hypothetical protein
MSVRESIVNEADKAEKRAIRLEREVKVLESNRNSSSQSVYISFYQFNSRSNHTKLQPLLMIDQDRLLSTIVSSFLDKSPHLLPP